MCGISGVFHYAEPQEVDPGVLRRMADTLIHRGPDDQGFHRDGSLGFAFRRLSIIDLAGGHQPILSPEGDRAIIFNGEIYNHPGLRQRLQQEGRVFRTLSDTEVILATYEKLGLSCVDELRGMFAFAIWDRRESRLLLARDRLGIKPLYYYDDGRRLIFGSEIKAILAHGDLKRELDPEAVADYFSLRYIPGPKSIYRHLRKLPPGHLLVVQAGKPPRLQRYWRLRFQPDEHRSEEDWIEGLQRLLDESVRLRLLAEVPLGAFLSGGIDSSAVVATMRRVAPGQVSTHSVGFEEAAFDEAAAAVLVANLCQTDHHQSQVRPDALEAVATLSRHFDEPFADSSAIPTWYVSRMARQKVTVALSGDGGDESFAGYARRYAFERREQRVRSLLPASLRQLLFGLPARLWPQAAWLPRPLRARTTLANLCLLPHQAFFNTMSSGSGPGMSPLLSSELRRDLSGYQPWDLFRQLMNEAETEDPVSRAQYVDFNTFLVDDILTKVDRASMAVSLEVRVPLLDHVLVEYAATIPSRLKLRGSKGKVIFKRALADRLPPQVLGRRKQGFEVPIGAWFRGPLREYAGDCLLHRTKEADAYLHGPAVKRLWKEHQSGRRDWTHQLWAVMMFKQWAATWNG